MPTVMSAHNRCFPHCINIATQTVLDELKTNPVDPVIGMAKDASELPHLTRYANALEADPVGKTRDLVTTCRSSGPRRRELQAVIAEGNKSGRWSREEGREIREVQLLRDCKTRWSSTFLLIDRALMLYPASDTRCLAHCTSLTHKLTGSQGVYPIT